MILRIDLAQLILLGLMLPLIACSAQLPEDEGMPLSSEWINEQAACHAFAADLIQPIFIDHVAISSVRTLWVMLSGSDSKLKDIILETAYEKRIRALTSPRDVFEVFDQVALRIEGYPDDGCGPLFHELLAEKLYLWMINAEESNTPDELAALPVDHVMQRRRKLLELLIEEAGRVGI